MAIPRTAVGTSTPPVTMTVERGRLQLFAEAIGERDPGFVDPEVARARGHRDLPVPPTFLFALELSVPDQFGWLTALGVDLRTLLHGTQSFTYTAQAYAGDTLTAVSTIADVYTKKNGTLEFVERHTRITRGGENVARLEQTAVIRHPAEPSA